jgi:trimeric autotransporter adhesin
MNRNSNGVPSPKGIEVFVDSLGQLGTFTSSRRYKKDIHPLGNLTTRLMALRPVSFRYKQAAEDGTYPLQYGLIAEEVARIAPELVAYDRGASPTR